MVKTRHQADSVGPDYAEFLSLQSRRTRRSQNLEHQLNGYASDESVEADSEIVLRRQSSSGPRRRSRRSNQPGEEEEEEEEKPTQRRTRRSGGGRVRQEPEDDDEDTEDEKPSFIRRRGRHKVATFQDDGRNGTECDEEGIRRSRRQRKLLYGTFDQNLIDDHMAIMADDRPSRRIGRPPRREERSPVHQDRSPPPKRRCRSREVVSEIEDDGQDMYSRVKRVRRQVKRDMYGMPITENKNIEESSSQSDSTDDDEEDDDDDDDDDDEEEEQPSRRSYFLREHKPRTNLYIAPINEPKPKPRSIFHAHSPPRTRGNRQHRSETYQSPARKKQSYSRRPRRRPAFHGDSSTSSSGSESSGDGSGDDEDRFERRKAKSMARARNRCLPMNYAKEDIQVGALRDRARIGSSLADVDPMNIDRSVTFEQVGGLGKHVQKLKEMVVFPLLYPEVFERFKISPPRGVLFYGPPGTGKTLVARALANECSTGERKVAFFMRKGADCLSKWVGESERQLRLLFDQAFQLRPSIIFFDEIDGLAPVRSSRQDQIHSSIVSTLLALMDGLDSRGEIVVIGATNRIDSIDPALRRPGRFDREFLFPLPSLSARSQILQIHTSQWNPKLCSAFIKELAEKCVGYCGADLRSLCTEAALHALRRRYPQIYTSNEKLELDVTSIEVSARDFQRAMVSIVPTAERSAAAPGRALSPVVRPLIEAMLKVALERVQGIFPSVLAELASIDTPVEDADADDALPMELYSDDDDDAPSIFEVTGRAARAKKRNDDEHRSYLDFHSLSSHCPLTHRPRLLLCGKHGQGQTVHLAPAILHALERVPVHVLDLPTLFAVSAKTPEEACAQVFREARRTAPSIIYMPHVGQWWEVIGETLRATFLMLLGDLQVAAPILLLATSDMPGLQHLPHELSRLFSEKANEVLPVMNPSEEERHHFFKDLILNQVKKPPPQHKKAAQRLLEVLPKAKPLEPRKLTPSELKRVQSQEASTMRELRIFLRDVLNKLGRDRKFAIFAKPVDIEEVPDYHNIIASPMDLSTMMSKIDLHKYQTVKEFMNDIELICSNALEYNPDKDPQGRAIRHRACALRDTAQAIITNELDQEFEKLCEEIVTARKRRGESPSKDIPSYYHTRPASNTIGQSLEEPTFSRRQRGDMAGGDTGVQDNDVPKLRQVYKRVQLRRGEPRNKNISPWCRPTRRRWKKVLVWVDEFGREVKPPGSSEEDTECEEDKKDDEKDNPAEESSQRTTRRSQESSHAGSTPHKPADNTSASAAAEEGESEFTLNSRRRTRSCAELPQVGKDTEEPTSPRSRSAGTSPVPVPPARMHSPRRRLSSPGPEPMNEDPPPPASPKHSPAKSPHTSPVSRAKPEVVVVENGVEKDGNGETGAPSVSSEDTMETTTSEEKEETETNKAEPEEEPSTTQRVTRSFMTAAQREAAMAVILQSMPEIVVDEDRLRHLLARIVAGTRGYTVEQLEGVYSRVSRAVYQHRCNYNKTQLTQDIEQIITSCSSHH